MQYSARWGNKGFLCTANKIVPLMDFKSTVSAKTETQTDTSGTSKVNIKGLELQKISLATIYLRAAGVDPRAQVEEWESLVTQYNDLYIEGKRFGRGKMMLKRVTTTDLLTTNTGKFLQAKVALEFEEYPEQTETNVTASTSKGSGGGGGSGGSSSSASSNSKSAADVYAETVEKKKAEKTTASKSDRAVKKNNMEAMLN